ncbi:MAG TPA: hypothetical protein VG248_03405 [Caulobacteraceae bacterium]|nr:hypothetical protein [Caulobacteraceae bacterium]
MNVPATVASVIYSGLASRIELDTAYGVEDLYDFLELIAVRAHNDRVAHADDH